MDATSAYGRVAERQFRRRPQAYAHPPTRADKKFIAFMISASGVARNDRVLDVACGAGTAAMAFAPRCKQVVGIDLMPEALQRAARLGVPNALFALGELERMPFADHSFSGAFCRFSFHHFVHPERVFAEMARVVESGGWIMIADTAASEDPDKAAFHNELERLCDPTHARALAPSEFERMFAEHGFRVVMKIARESRMTVDDWIRFGGASEHNALQLRRLVEDAMEAGKTDLKFTREGDAIRMLHTTINFVIEKEI
jgi:ubiquinone/menaquinone biosynthesis C-methylase UbiE